MKQIILVDHSPSLPDELHSSRTSESISSENTEISTRCLFCNKNNEPFVNLINGSFSHRACREFKGCCICGNYGLTLQCRHSGCDRVYHPSCFAHFENPIMCDDLNLLCDLHSRLIKKKKDYLRAGLARQVSHRLNEGSDILNLIKNSQGSLKSANVCVGSVL